MGDRINTLISYLTTGAGAIQILGVIPDIIGCIGVLIGIGLSYRMIQKVTADREKIQLEKKKLELEIKALRGAQGQDKIIIP